MCAAIAREKSALGHNRVGLEVKHISGRVALPPPFVLIDTEKLDSAGDSDDIAGHANVDQMAHQLHFDAARNAARIANVVIQNLLHTARMREMRAIKRGG